MTLWLNTMCQTFVHRPVIAILSLTIIIDCFHCRDSVWIVGYNRKKYKLCPRLLYSKHFGEMLHPTTLTHFHDVKLFWMFKGSRFYRTDIHLCRWFKVGNLNVLANFVSDYDINTQSNIAFYIKMMNSYFQVCLVFSLTQRKYLHFAHKPAGTTIRQRWRAGTL